MPKTLKGAVDRVKALQSFSDEIEDIYTSSNCHKRLKEETRIELNSVSISYHVKEIVKSVLEHEVNESDDLFLQGCDRSVSLSFFCIFKTVVDAREKNRRNCACVCVCVVGLTCWFVFFWLWWEIWKKKQFGRKRRKTSTSPAHFSTNRSHHTSKHCIPTSFNIKIIRLVTFYSFGFRGSNVFESWSSFRTSKANDIEIFTSTSV